MIWPVPMWKVHACFWERAYTPSIQLLVKFRVPINHIPLQVSPFLARSLVHSGYTPVLKLEISSYGLDNFMNVTKVLYNEGALVQFQQSSSKTNVEGDFLLM